MCSGQRFLAWITRRESRVERWAAEALPERRVVWHRSRLSHCARQLEACFVGISKALEGLASRSGSLLESSRNIMKLSSGQQDDESIFQSSIDLMDRPLNFNDGCLEITSSLNASLVSISERIRRLGGLKGKFDAAMNPLRILQTMFRIESASSPPDVRSLFTSLSAEIENLMGEMSTLIAREFESIGSTVPMMEDVVVRVRTLRERQMEAQRGRKVMREAMAQIEARFEQDKARGLHLIAASESIAQKIAGMVAALQYQDILNQRLQHVIEGLDDIAEEARRLADVTGAPARHADAPGFLHDAARVEAAQLEGIEEVLNGAVANLSGALKGLAGDAGALGAECSSREGSRTGDAAAEAMVQILLETIRLNTDLIESTFRQTGEIGVALKPIAGLLGKLTSSILKMSGRIRLIALNAQIQAAQTGEGTGLEVLACQARTVAEEITAHVVKIAEELGRVKQELASALRQVEHVHDRSMELLSFLARDGGSQAGRLRRFQSRMLAERRGAGEYIEEIQAESGRLSSLLGIRTDVLEIIWSARTELQEFSAELSTRLRRGSSGEGVEEHAKSYTAQAERTVHQRAMQRDIPGGQDPVAAVPALVEGSVELF